MLATNYPLADVFLSTLYFVLFLLWLVLAFHVLHDVLQSDDLSGPAKASWILVILVLPLVGCLVYVVRRGGTVHERRLHAIQLQHRAFEDYIRGVAQSKE